MMTLMRKYTGRLPLLLVASLTVITLGCATWEDHRGSSGENKANTEVAIFKAHLDSTRRIVSASDGRIEYQYDPAQTRALGFAAHPRIRLLPGRYIVTIKTWPFGSLHEFEVDLEAGHIYKVETYLCSMECISVGKPYRYDMWIQDFTTRERISHIVSECFLGKKRGRERRKVPCPDEEIPRDPGGAAKANDEVPKDEAGSRVSDYAAKANAETARDEEGFRESVCAVKANPELAVFKAHENNVRRIVSVSEGVKYQYDPELKRTKRSSDPELLIALPPGPHTITVSTWPFGTLYDFEVDLKGGHTYEVQTDLCAFECISVGEPYRHDRWIQDLTTRKRISDIVSECYLGKKKSRRERRKVACPDD